MIKVRPKERSQKLFRLMQYFNTLLPPSARARVPTRRRPRRFCLFRHLFTEKRATFDSCQTPRAFVSQSSTNDMSHIYALSLIHFSNR